MSDVIQGKFNHKMKMKTSAGDFFRKADEKETE